MIATRMTPIAAVVASLLLGVVAVQADPHTEPSRNPHLQATPKTDTGPPPTTTASPDADTAADAGNTEVGSRDSNVDKDSSSGSYYPYSAGTVGDDPSEPTSTSLPADAGDTAPGPTDQWGDAADSDGDGYLSLAELTKAAPALSASFDAMDVDKDDKLTRGEFRSWNESRKARVNTDEKATSATDDRPPTPTDGVSTDDKHQ
jgi:hypothetical protein